MLQPLTIFPSNAFVIKGIAGDENPTAYHFDAVVKYDLEMLARYTRYPIESGVELTDHAYNEPTKLVVYGYQGSDTLRLSFDDPASLAEFGASAVIGNIGDPVLSAAAGLIGANMSFQAGSKATRGQKTLDFLRVIKERFATFDVVTGLTLIRSLKIDKIHIPVTEENETGLHFVVEMSQQFVNGADRTSMVTGEDFANMDTAQIQASTLVDRGRISLGN